MLETRGIWNLNPGLLASPVQQKWNRKMLASIRYGPEKRKVERKLAGWVTLAGARVG